MKLRRLQVKDAPLMLEWMRDRDITAGLHEDYSGRTLAQAEEFIRAAAVRADERHYAVASDEDEYMGTVSLRHIDPEGAVAELTVVMRRCALNKGYAMRGMIEALDIAFRDLKLGSVYWRVKADNVRAIRFFTKHGFNMLDEDVPADILARHSNEKDLVWFAALKGDDYRNAALSRGTVAGCRIIRIKTVPTIEAGELSFFEAGRDIGFDIKRIYYISKVPEGKRRGFHAHKELKQLLFCPYGEIQLILDDGTVREEITLNDPSVGIVIEKPVWREMLWLKKDSVLCVAASDYYNPYDYIRDYSEFMGFMSGRHGCNTDIE